MAAAAAECWLEAELALLLLDQAPDHQLQQHPCYRLQVALLPLLLILLLPLLMLEVSLVQRLLLPIPQLLLQQVLRLLLLLHHHCCLAVPTAAPALSWPHQHQHLRLLLLRPVVASARAVAAAVEAG